MGIFGGTSFIFTEMAPHNQNKKREKAKGGIQRVRAAHAEFSSPNEIKTLKTVYTWEELKWVILAALGFATFYYVHTSTLHENLRDFAHIKPVVRRISFQSEQSLYYSYYEDKIKAESTWAGLRGLSTDRESEYPTTVNLLERMNLLPEVLISLWYRVYLNVATVKDPIFVYIESFFIVQGTMAGSLFILGWQISGSKLGGLIASLFLFYNSKNVTLPLLSLQ